MMLSRVADAFFWMSRYLERAEHSARSLEVYVSLTLDSPTEDVGRSLLAALGALPEPEQEDGDDGPRVPVVQTYAPGGFDTRHLETIKSHIEASRENARQIREQITAEMWRQINTMYLTLCRSGQSATADPGAFLRAVIEGANLFNGVTSATLSHGGGYHYMELGLYLERATSTAEMLEECFADPAPPSTAEESRLQYAEWVGLLRACAAYESYCRFYTADIRPERLTEFLLLNAESPRSVRFAADRLEASLRNISRGLGRQATSRPERFAGRLRAALNYGTIDEIIEDSLVRYVASIRKQCDQIHAAMYQTYITYPIESAIAR
jgi:uncharacterized alpha-E superfamily protein